MQPLLLAATLATLVAAPQTAPLAQPNAASPVAPVVRAPSNEGAGDSIAPQPRTVASSRGALVAHAGDAELMDPAHNAMSHRTDDSTQTPRIVGGVAIRAVADGAGFVTLADGTTWQIALVDRPRVRQWRPGDYVIVRFAPIAEQPNFEYRLVNGRDKSQALVAFAGLPDIGD